ncbi:MAG TPA: hypothetical protein PL110_18795 [Candidatus Eremiobacteraeota bacterium]|nr:hypothetical protein [Candidatus Eremiobacteraeota bacterium]
MKNFYLFILSLILLLILIPITLYGQQKDISYSYPALNSILKSCEEHRGDFKGKYYVPGAWTVDPLKGEKDLSKMVSSGELINPVSVESPYILIEKTIQNIIEYDTKNKPSETIDVKTGKGVIAVNFLPRVLSMYDNDGDTYIGVKEGKDITLNAEGVRETGTFIKNILILPYLKALGYNTVHLQPITEIGIYGRKGNLGSPFAIRDPFTIEPSLADPLFEESAEEQYRAFIEAAHALDMKVIQEVIPRTVSIDSTVLEKNPSYGYWIKEGTPRRMPDYYSPKYDYQTFTGKRRFPDRKSFEDWFFNEYKSKIYGGQYTVKDLIDVNQTDREYVNYFMPPPDVVKRDESGKLIGYYYKLDSKGEKIEGEIDEIKRSEVFPAFCDTPFEIQPFWQDVTYLKLYVDPTCKEMPILNVLSYVTAKFFKDVEPEIEQKYRNKPVWDMIKGYFDKFKNMGVDGFVLDMGHALPEDLKKEIKNVFPVVWEENLGAGFTYLVDKPVIITGKVFSYALPSYNDATEIKLYETHPEETITYHIKNMRKLFEEISQFDDYKGKMFGFPDNYNTKRIGQSPATRNLSEAPLKNGIPDFTLAPVDQVKARKITLLYYTLFKIISEKEGNPFILNPVFGTEFVATSTVNVGLSTHIEEAGRFYEYMTPEEREKNPDAERLLLMSKPDKLSGEWTNKNHIAGEILELNQIMKELKPLLKKYKHLQVIDEGKPEILFLLLSEPGNDEDFLVLMANLDLEKEKSVKLENEVLRYYYNRPKVSPEPEEEGEIKLPPATVTVFTYKD